MCFIENYDNTEYYKLVSNRGIHSHVDLSNFELATTECLDSNMLEKHNISLKELTNFSL